MKSGIFVLLILPLLTAGWAAHAEDSAAQALVELKTGDKAHAYVKLEHAFQSESDPAFRGQIAQLLAVANPKYLHDRRDSYARFALQHAPALTNEQKGRLYRIWADEAFNHAELDSAMHAYQEALKVPEMSADDREYLTYKQGWVLMNLKQPREAMRLWTDWLASQKGGDLRDSMATDTGKAYVEALYAEKGSVPAIERPLEARDLKSFQQGVIRGIKRMPRANLADLETALRQSPFYTDFVSAELESGLVLLSNTCDELGWIENADFSKLPISKVQTLLENCAHQQPKRSGKDWPRIAQLYKKIPLEGAARWPRAQALAEAHVPAEACSELQSAAAQVLAKNDSKEWDKLPTLLASLDETCRKAERAISGSLAASLIQSKKIAQASNTQSGGASAKTWLSVLMAFGEHKDTRAIFVQELARNASVWHSHPFPELLMERADTSQKRELLFTFAPLPLSGQYRTVVENLYRESIKAQNWQESHELLSRFWPLSKVDDLGAIRLWSTLSLAHPIAEAETVRVKQFELLHAAHDQGAEQDLQTLLAVLLKAGDWNRVFSESELFFPVILKDPALTDAAIQHYVSKLETGSTSDATQALPQTNALSRYLVVLDGVYKGSNVAPRSSTLPKSIERSQFNLDLMKLSRAHSLQEDCAKVNFKPGPRLAKDLSQKVMHLKNVVQNLSRSRWVSEALLSRADQSVREATQSFSKKISAIPVENPADKQDLLALANTVAQWRIKE